MVRPHLIGLTIYKMTGSGNDFAMLDGRLTTPDDWTEADIRAVCARGTGVGADGLVFVARGSEPGSARMIYFNSDGSRAAMCGNAALCSTQLAARLEVTPPGGGPMRLETDAGTYEARPGPGHDRAEIHLAGVRAPGVPPDIHRAAEERDIKLVNVGVPHLIIVVEDVDSVDVRGRGRALRFAPALGPAGANANFVSPTDNPAIWRMRTYERGVEDETLACGTGAIAAACALEQSGLAGLPVAILTRSGRGLEVRARRMPDGGYDDVWLAGEARLVFRGILT